MNPNKHIDIDLGFLSEDDARHAALESVGQEQHANALLDTPSIQPPADRENHPTTVMIGWKDLAVFVGIVVFLLIFLSYFFSAIGE